MGTFNSTKFIPTELKDISGVVNETREYFASQGYEVNVEDSSYGSFISLSKGGIFKSILGMKTSLNVEIKCLSGGISVEAKVGIFGQQAIPTLIMYFVAWPVALTQISGLVKQAKLDDEVISVIERSIYRHQSGEKASASENNFCTACGAKIAAGSAFCSSCGAKQG